MLFKKNMLVILTNGRMASCKAVILDILPDNRLLVTGYVNRKKRIRESKGAKLFIKRMNPIHVLATSHSLTVNIKVKDNIFEDIKLKRETIDSLESELSGKKEKEAEWMRTKLIVK
ncbi:putative Translation protein SH3-like, subgroup protein [Pseudoloma neurophilia]|uniref:Putative Translation protein SH3-like, subgroup protein n=1 Tax=Pseudoloma neurophilia TaxID=146866 RepID=A0A0R0M0Q1_9MICR|nr:putative Translation protein SH3-like, subgroup protein [Pseudoloma neurophilia]